MLTPIYTGAGTNPRTYEYYDFIGRPARKIKHFQSDESGSFAYFAYELYVRELHKWVPVEGVEEPQEVGSVEDINEDVSKQLGGFGRGGLAEYLASRWR